MSDLPKMMRCWPKAWRDAAVEAGLATQLDGAIRLHDHEMIWRLEIFAQKILEAERVECVRLALEFASPGCDTEADAIADAIRTRSK